jgi:hypothetical protein
MGEGRGGSCIPSSYLNLFCEPGATASAYFILKLAKGLIAFAFLFLFGASNQPFVACVFLNAPITIGHPYLTTLYNGFRILPFT